MSNDKDSRINELKVLIQEKSIAGIEEKVIEELFQFEQKMSENRASLISLMIEGILTETEVEKKIELCFENFLKKTVVLIGKENCKEIYDYLPGEKLGFLADLDENNSSELAINYKALKTALNATENLPPSHVDRSQHLIEYLSYLDSSPSLKDEDFELLKKTLKSLNQSYIAGIDYSKSHYFHNSYEHNLENAFSAVVVYDSAHIKSGLDTGLNLKLGRLADLDPFNPLERFVFTKEQIEAIGKAILQVNSPNVLKGTKGESKTRKSSSQRNKKTFKTP